MSVSHIDKPRGNKDSDKDKPTSKTSKAKTSKVFAYSIVTDEFLAETVYMPYEEPPLQYAKCNSEGDPNILVTFEHGNKQYFPPAINTVIEYKMVKLPSGVEEYGSDSDLDAAICTYINRYLQLNPFQVELIMHYVKMTWVYDLFSAIPYLRCMGGYGSAKTRIAELTTSICYRPIIGGVAVTPATLFRLVDQYQGTFFIDEADFKSSDLNEMIVQVLNCGYRKGGVVPRCNKDNEVEVFRVFGPKVLTTRKKFEDSALESRCLTLEIPENITIRDDIKFHLSDSAQDDALHLRNKLLLWRFRNYNRIIRDDETKLRTYKGLDPRTIEVSVPLVSVSNDPTFIDRLAKFWTKAVTERRADQPQVYIVGAMRDLLGKELAAEIKVGDIAHRASLLWLHQNPYATADGRKPAGDYYNAKWAGSLVRGLGFDTKHKRDGAVVMIMANKVKKWVEKYDPPDFSNRGGVI